MRTFLAHTILVGLLACTAVSGADAGPWGTTRRSSQVTPSRGRRRRCSRLRTGVGLINAHRRAHGLRLHAPTTGWPPSPRPAYDMARRLLPTPTAAGSRRSTAWHAGESAIARRQRTLPLPARPTRLLPPGWTATGTGRTSSADASPTPASGWPAAPAAGSTSCSSSPTTDTILPTSTRHKGTRGPAPGAFARLPGARR